jgi:hypothetical protein
MCVNSGIESGMGILGNLKFSCLDCFGIAKGKRASIPSFLSHARLCPHTIPIRILLPPLPHSSSASLAHIQPSSVVAFSPLVHLNPNLLWFCNISVCSLLRQPHSLLQRPPSPPVRNEHHQRFGGRWIYVDGDGRGYNRR